MRSKANQGWSIILGDAAAVALLILLSLVIALPRWRSGIDWGDEGLLAYGGVRVMEGQIPNRDFVSLQPPLSFYVAATMFKMLGTSLGALRILGLAIYLLIPLLLYGIARCFAKPAVAMAAGAPAVVLGLPYFYFVPLAVWQGITSSLVAALLYLEATLHGRRVLAAPAGIMTAASILLRHDQGVYLFISIVVLSLALKRVKGEPVVTANLGRIFTWWLAGIAIVIVPATVYWWAQQALPEMFRQLLVFPVTVYGETSSLPFRYFDLRLPFSRNGITALYYVPPIVIAIAIVWLIRRRRSGRFSSREAVFAFLIAWSGLFYFQVLTRSDVFHLLMTLPPFFVLAAFMWRGFVDSIFSMRTRPIFGSIHPQVLASVIAAACLIGFLWAITPVCLPDVTEAKATLNLARGRVRVANPESIEQLVAAIQIHAPADRSILCLPYQPVFYFLCERRNPTRWNYFWPGDQTPQDHQTFINEAKSDPPAAVVIINEQKMTSYASMILDYVHSEFRPAGNSGELTLYLPR